MRIKSLFVFAVVVAIGVIAASPAQAAIVETDLNTVGAWPLTNPYPCATTDLISGATYTWTGTDFSYYTWGVSESLLPSLLNDNATYPATMATFWDGSSPPLLDMCDYTIVFAQGNPSASVTYTLAAASNITEISVYGGWSTDADAQRWAVYYSTATDPDTFNLLRSVEYDPQVPVSGGSLTKVSLTDDTGILASDVVKIRFDIYSKWGSYADGLGEIDVLPEPATMALMALGGVGLLLKRRRSK